MLFIQHLHPAAAAAPARPQVRVGVTGQLVLLQAARRAAAAHALAVAEARAEAARAAAARAEAARAAAARAEAARAAAARAAAQAAAARAAQQQALQREAVAARGSTGPGGTGSGASGQGGGQQQPGPVSTPAPQAPSGAPQEIAQQLLGQYGWGGQFSCLDSLWERESGWNPAAENPSSGAYGIPQALPASKMASAGGDWQTDAATQIRWGLSYIQSVYGSPCGAWAHEVAQGWY